MKLSTVHQILIAGFGVMAALYGLRALWLLGTVGGVVNGVGARSLEPAGGGGGGLPAALPQAAAAAGERRMTGRWINGRLLLAAAVASLTSLATAAALTLEAPGIAPSSAALAAAPRQLATGLVPTIVPLPEPLAPTAQPLFDQPRLKVTSLGMKLILDVVPFRADGSPDPEAFATIKHAFRSRGGHEVDIHPRLVELLVTISLAYDGAPLQLISAHREPGYGTRKTSYHVRGMAADIAVRGVKVHELRDTALRLGARGVGCVPQVRPRGRARRSSALQVGRG